MRRLLTWIAILIGLASLSLVSVRGASDKTCVQLVAPRIGSVLTVDMNTGLAILDSRTVHPVPTPTAALSWYDDFFPSPDRQFLIETQRISQGLYLRKLWIKPRSVAPRTRLNTDKPIEYFVWSPTSTHFAFSEVRSWNTNKVSLINVGIADTRGNVLQRVEIPALWRDSNQNIIWSPDGTMIILLLHKTHVGDTLLVHSVTDNQSRYLHFYNETIYNIHWSPTSDHVLVVTSDVTLNTYHIYLISRDNHEVKQLSLPSQLSERLPNYFLNTANPDIQIWSTDGRYFVLERLGQLYVFDLDGKSQFPPLLDVKQYLWTTLPHTLLYVVPQNGQRMLMQLDAASRQVSTFIDNIAFSVDTTTVADESMFYVVQVREQEKSLLHKVSFDLGTHATLFGEVTVESHNIFPMRSPDQRKLAIPTNEATTLGVLWLVEGSSEIHRVELAKQGEQREWLEIDWLNNDILLITQLQSDRKKEILLDTQSSQIMELSTLFSHQLGLVWHDDVRLAITNPLGITVYRMSDGQVLYTVGTPEASHMRPRVFGNPDGRSLLALYDINNSSDGFNNLYLISPHSIKPINTVNQIVSITYPAWSPDGKMFAYGVIEPNDPRLQLKILSRDGTLLKEHWIVTHDDDPYYLQVRWTSCD